MFSGMSEQSQEIDLQPGQYRQVFNGPLANPRALRLAVAIFLLASLFSAAVAIWLRDVWWLVLCPIPMAMGAGAGLAGLWPNRVFGNGSKDDPIV